MLSPEEEANIRLWLGAFPPTPDHHSLLERLNRITDRQKGDILWGIGLSKDGPTPDYHSLLERLNWITVRQKRGVFNYTLWIDWRRIDWSKDDASAVPGVATYMAMHMNPDEKAARLRFLTNLLALSEHKYKQTRDLERNWDQPLYIGRDSSLYERDRYLSPPPVLWTIKSCDRCGPMPGKYYSMAGANLCRRCAWRVRIRAWMFAAKPNREVRSLVKAAVEDLRRARRYNKQDQQLKTHLKEVRSLMSSAGGGGVAYFTFWVPLWLVVGTWDCLTSLCGLIVCAIGGPFAVYWLWRQGGDIRTVGVIVGAIMGLAVLLGGIRWITRGVYVLLHKGWDGVTELISEKLQGNVVFGFLQYIARCF